MSEDIRDILEQTQETFPFSFSALHSSDGSFDVPSSSKPSCTGIAAFYSMLCIVAKCLDTENNADYSACAHKRCRFMQLDQECITCLSITPTSEAIKTCFFNVTQNINVPGLLLLSKKPMINPTETRFIPGVNQILPRSYLMADVSL